MEIPLTTTCSACHGTGVRTYNTSPNGPLVEENPCTECGGDGRAPSYLSLDATALEDIMVNQVLIIADLDYIHGKVTAIWNQVKP